MNAPFGTRNRADRADRADRTDRTDRPGPIAEAARLRSAYTLIELVSVTALATILIALAVAGYHTWTRDTAVEAGQQRLQSALIRARSYALAHRVETRCLAVLQDPATARSDAIAVEYRHSTTSAWQLVSQTNALPNWVVYDESHTTHVYFLADGSCQATDPADQSDPSDPIGWLHLQLRHANVVVDDTADPRYSRSRRALEVNRRTGLVRESLPRETP
jgi:Tfp pilus assembly protein FimT